MKITRVDVLPLTGGTVDGGWPQGHEPQENLHTLVEVHTDEGISGVGSCFTSGKLVQGAVELLWPLMKGESGVEPERVSEKLRASSFWQGRGGAVEHAISGIDIALWDIMGKACGQPVSRLLGGNYRSRIRPYGSILFDEPDVLRTRLEDTVARGFKSIKLGWRPFGRRDRKFDELLVRTARETVGEEIELMVDAGGSEQFWPHGLNWARETAKMLADYDIVWFEEPLPPDDLAGFIELTKQSPVPISGGEVLTRRQAFQPWIEQRAFDIVQPDATKNGGLSESRRIAPGWRTTTTCSLSRTAGTRRSASPLTCSLRQPFPSHGTSRSDAVRLHREPDDRTVRHRCGAILRFRTDLASALNLIASGPSIVAGA